MIAVLFLAYALIYTSTLSFQTIISISILYRLLFFFSIPTLSDDFYRFIWDGFLIKQNINPFLHVPQFYIQRDISVPILDTLYFHLNSPYYFTVYPPVCQFIFYFSAISLKSPEDLVSSLILIRTFILIGELGSFYFLYSLLKKQGFSTKYTILYTLNPLIIIEFAGNLHFEALMISFLLGAFFFLEKKQYSISAICFTLAVATKFLPLILLPFLIKILPIRYIIRYYAVVGFMLIILFSPFLSWKMLQHISESIYLYFNTFEFNASIYYIIRWIGYQWVEYNIIHIAGKILLLFPIGYILCTLLRSKPIKDSYALYLFCFGIYFATATVVHPWYISTMIVLGLLSNYRFSILWSALGFLSYNAYVLEEYKENLWLVTLEYTVVYSYFFLEYYSKRYLNPN